jgi:short-subunit dehydrogenase
MTSTALITGASTGIGATYADRLARRGHDVILVARDRTRLEALAARLRGETGRSVQTLPADLGTEQGVALVAQRLRDDARIGVFVNNAGMAVAEPVLVADPARLEAMLRLNVLAAGQLAVAAAQAFVGRGGGSIINLASVLALAPELFNGVYNATKSFMLTLSQALQAEAKGTALRVQAVLPGATRTEIWSRAGVDPASLREGSVMEVDAMVDAALAGLDAGEAVTIPSLPDAADWQRLEAARMALLPNLSRDLPAARYRRPE